MKLKIIIIILLTLIASCNKKRKIELKEEAPIVSNTKVQEVNTKLTPKLFFQITRELNKVTEKYDKLIKKSPTNESKKLMEKLNKEIERIYSKYNTSETELNNYSAVHYRELEKYIEEHPEIER